MVVLGFFWCLFCGRRGERECLAISLESIPYLCTRGTALTYSLGASWRVSNQCEAAVSGSGPRFPNACFPAFQNTDDAEVPLQQHVQSVQHHRDHEARRACCWQRQRRSFPLQLEMDPTGVATGEGICLCPSLKFHLEHKVLESHEPLGDAVVGVHGPCHSLEWGVVGHQHELTTQVVVGQVLHLPLNGEGFLFGGGELSA